MIEFKWLMIAFAVVMSSLALADAVEKYSVNQCRVAAISNNVPADKIGQACGKPIKEK
jgi:hypothetical protein